MLEKLSIIIASGVISLILFQSFIIAPDINKELSKKSASKFLRHIWPKFFIIISVLCLINSAVMYFGLLIFSKEIFISTLNCGLMLFCYLITPTINRAKDQSNVRLWSYLHILTILITITVLISNVYLIL